MTLAYELVQSPNQVFSTTIGSYAVEISIRTFRGLSYVSISVDGETVEAGVRAMPNISLFTENVNETLGGKFYFSCTTDDYPHYLNFDGVSCRLLFEEA